MPVLRHLSTPKFEVRWPAAAIWLSAWTLLWRLDGVLNLGNLALLLVLASAMAGVWLSALVSVGCSALSVLMFNWFFVEPRLTFSVHLHQDMLLLVTMMAVSSVVSYLMARLRMAAALESQHADASEQLRSLGETLREVRDLHAQGEVLQSLLIQNTRCDVSVLLLQDVASEQATAEGHWVGEPQVQDVQGLWACVQQMGAMGPGTGRHENQSTVFLPLRGHVRALGAVALRGAGLRSLTALQRDMLQQACDVLGLELERAQTLRLAQKAKDDAQSQSLRNTLLTSISHDYRTPLANLMGAASVIQAQAPRLSTDKVAGLAQTILDEAQHLNRMTTNTLQLARLDSAPLQIKKDWESLQEILGSVMAKARQRHPQRQIVVAVPDRLPLIQCDAILLVQLFDNLMENAIKYSPSHTPIEIQVLATAQALEVRMIDQGTGIVDAWKDKVFQAFERVHADIAQPDSTDDTSLRRGMGVGLAVCKAIAKVHGATIWVEDHQPQGAVMCLSLPVAPQPDVCMEG
jgi:two-component system, OmpR family, sensor histidine kinase KdpD